MSNVEAIILGIALIMQGIKLLYKFISLLCRPRIEAMKSYKAISIVILEFSRAVLSDTLGRVVVGLFSGFISSKCK